MVDKRVDGTRESSASIDLTGEREEGRIVERSRFATVEAWLAGAIKGDESHVRNLGMGLNAFDLDPGKGVVHVPALLEENNHAVFPRGHLGVVDIEALVQRILGCMIIVEKC